MFYPPEGGCGSSSQGVQLILFPFYWYRKRYLGFQFTDGFLPFLNIENVLSPGGRLRKQLPRGPIVFTFNFIGEENGTVGSKIQFSNPPFWKPSDVLSPGGTLRSRARKGSNCFYFTFYWCRKRYWGFQNPHLKSAFLKTWKCFIPRRDSAEQSPKGVQLFLLYILLV